MQRFLKALVAIMLITAVFCTVGCNKNDNSGNDGDNNNGNNDSDVRVTTYTPQDITATTAVCGGDVIVIQGLTLNELGVCWSTNPVPTTGDSYQSTREWDKPFVCTLWGLEPETKYYVRAYALRGLEYYYGEIKSLFTLTEGNLNSHDYVDLGLPSGTCWATCNVGAATPGDYGDYFAWGETETKTTYDWSTYKYCNYGSYHQLTKYCYGSSVGANTIYGIADRITILQPEDDAATANWGSDWCMPTEAQWMELYQNTSNTWTTQNGVDGKLFVGSNGRNIFLPAAGYCMDSGPNHICVGTELFYWSSSLRIDGSFQARYNGGSYDRCYGFSVRPVRSSR